MKSMAVVLAMVWLCFTAVRPADAAFFDNSGGYRDISQWVIEHDEDDAAQITVHNGDRLEFSATVPATNNGYLDEGDVEVWSKWSLDTSKSFNISVDFHVDHIGSGKPAETLLDPSDLSDFDKVQAGFELFDANEDGEDSFRLEAQNSVSSWDGIGSNWFNYEIHSTSAAVAVNDPAADTWSGAEQSYVWERDLLDGTLVFDYDALQDKLTATMLGTAFDGSKILVATSVLDQFIGLTGIKQLGVGFDVWATEPSSFIGEDVNFYNFKLAGAMIEPVVTPEPVSMALFGIGGAAMALTRRKPYRS